MSLRHTISFEEKDFPDFHYHFLIGKLPLLTKIYNSSDKKKQVKRTFVQALRLCTGRTAHRGSRGIALLFLDHGTRRE